MTLKEIKKTILKRVALFEKTGKAENVSLDAWKKLLSDVQNYIDYERILPCSELIVNLLYGRMKLLDSQTS